MYICIHTYIHVCVCAMQCIHTYMRAYIHVSIHHRFCLKDRAQ